MSASDDRLDQLDYYTLLGVARDASAPEIKRAFRTFALRYHPDRFAGAPQDKVERATAIYRRGSEAVETLTNPEARKAYDGALARGELRLTTDARARGGGGGARASVRGAPKPGATRRTGKHNRPSSAGMHASPHAPTAHHGQAHGHSRTAGAPSLVIHSPSARAYYNRAVEAARAGDWKTAHRALKSAEQQEPGNTLIAQALEKVERNLRGW